MPPNLLPEESLLGMNFSNGRSPRCVFLAHVMVNTFLDPENDSSVTTEHVGLRCAGEPVRSAALALGMQMVSSPPTTLVHEHSVPVTVAVAETTENTQP